MYIGRDIVGVTRLTVAELRREGERHLVADAELGQRRLPASDDLPLAERELERVAAIIFVEFGLLACVDIDR